MTARWVSELASDLRPQLPVPVAPSGAAQSGVIQLDPGTWVVRAEAPGAEPAEVQIKVAAGAPLTAELALKPLPKETGPETQRKPGPDRSPWCVARPVSSPSATAWAWRRSGSW
ncbi:hypothetical protein [Nannocystis pusilla]|uniref:hypothetical protein n=1 Tax=Nannocystis pusilla TaxID=889268 RepID=UPI003B7F6810